MTGIKDAKGLIWSRTSCTLQEHLANTGFFISDGCFQSFITSSPFLFGVFVLISHQSFVMLPCSYVVVDLVFLETIVMFHF